jgi:hypothetical protein
MPIHPKAAGATFAAVLTAVILAILTQSGVHITTDLATSIEGLAVFAGAWLPATPTPVVAMTTVDEATQFPARAAGDPGFPPS